jgi:ribosomal protein S18 acetylase RimI-like enzyme
MHPSPPVRRATADDVETAAATLADAFSADPVLSWILPPGIVQRRRRMTGLWRRTIRSYLRHDKPLFITTDADGRANGEGAALWAPPGSWPTPFDEVRDFAPFLVILGTGLIRGSRVTTTMLRHHPRQPPHWYLYAIGTQAAVQGRGVGSALLRDRLEQLDAEGLPAYLESSNIRNVPLYERHGFTVVEEIAVGHGGPTLWRMWREPGS